MKKKPGVLPKFPNQETVKLRIDRVVPKDIHDEIKQKCNDIINKLQSESLTKCADEALKSK